MNKSQVSFWGIINLDTKRIIFIYYRITEAVNYLYSNWKLMVRKKYKGQHAEYLQLKIKFK